MLEKQMLHKFQMGSKTTAVSKLFLTSLVFSSFLYFPLSFCQIVDVLAAWKRQYLSNKRYVASLFKNYHSKESPSLFLRIKACEAMLSILCAEEEEEKRASKANLCKYTARP